MIAVVDDAARIRVIRALLGLSSRDFAKLIGVRPNAVGAWEKGRNCPQREKRKELAELCRKEGICFLPSGMPVPQADLVPSQENVA